VSNNGNGIVIDASQLFAKIAAIQRGARPEAFLLAIGLRLMAWVDQNFRAEGLEQRWRPLSPNTVAQRRRGSSKTLQDTGRLRMSFTRAAGNPKILGDTVRVTSNVAYAPFHEFGTGPYTIRPKKPGGRLAFRTASGMVFAKQVNHPGVPKRQMTPTPDTARKLAVDTMQAALSKALRAARFTP
jgi:phage gpG-like protein